MAEMETTEPAKLGRGNLRLADVVAQAVGFMGPVFSVTFFLTAIGGASLTGKGAGINIPISLILAAIGMLGVAWIISRFAKRIHAAGSLYDYVTAAFGRRAGFVAGWTYYGGMTALTLAIGLAFGGFLSLTLSINHDIDIDWYWLAIAFWIVAGAIMVLGVQISTRLQLILALVSMIVILAFAIYVILKGGADGLSGAPFNPGNSTFTGIFYGMLYAVIMFIGFETAANLAEETAEPKRSIPIAVFASVIVVGIFYVIVSYGLLAAFGFDIAAFLDLANFPPLYAASANPEFGGDNFAELVQWMVVLDIAAVGLGTATGTSRGYFALGPRRPPAAHPGPRERPLPHPGRRERRPGGGRDHRDHHRPRDRRPRPEQPRDRPGRVVRLLPVGRDVRRHVPGAGLPGGQPDGLPGPAGREPGGPGGSGGARRSGDDRGGLRRGEGRPAAVRPRQDLVGGRDPDRRRHRADVHPGREGRLRTTVGGGDHGGSGGGGRTCWRRRPLGAGAATS